VPFAGLLFALMGFCVASSAVRRELGNSRVEIELPTDGTATNASVIQAAMRCRVQPVRACVFFVAAWKLQTIEQGLALTSPIIHSPVAQECRMWDPQISLLLLFGIRRL
jgi:hypothetical protein